MSSATRFNVVRYGNVYGSNGSVVNLWEKDAKDGKRLKVTDPGMTRFFWKKECAAQFILDRLSESIENNESGLTYIPKMNSFSMMEIAKGFSDKIDVVGMRCPEKMHEDLISVTEGAMTSETSQCYIIFPPHHAWKESLISRGTAVGKGFYLSSAIE